MGKDEKKVENKGGEPGQPMVKKPETQAKSPVAPEKPARSDKMRGQPRHTSTRRSLIPKGKKRHPALSVNHLAARTGTDTLVLGALKAAFDWTEKTRLTKEQFLHTRDAWLSARPEEVVQ